MFGLFAASRAGISLHANAFKMNFIAPLVRYGVAILAVALAVAGRHFLDQGLHVWAPFNLLYAAIIISALVGGLGAGLLATLLGVAASLYYAIEPFYSLRVEHPISVIYLILFVLVGALISWIVEVLKRERDYIATVLDTVDSLVIVLDREGRIVRFNRACERATGYALAEVRGKPFWEILTDREEVDTIQLTFQRITAGQLAGLHECHWIMKGGTRRLIAWSNTVIRDGRGRVRQVIGTGTDVTERRQVERALRKSNERFELAARATNDAVWDWDLATDSLYWGAGITTLFGYRREEVGPDLAWWSEHIHPEDRQPLLEDIHQVLASGQALWQGEYRYARADGSYATVLDRGYVLYDEAGQPVRMIGAMADVTERRQAEEALRESETRLSVLIENLPFDFWTCDAGGRYVLINSVCRRHWGDLRGFHPRELHLPPPILELWENNNSRALRGEIVRGEVSYTVGYEERTYFNIIAPIRDGEKIRGMLGVNIDITELKQAEAKLIRQAEVLVDADRRKDVFLAMLAHELRNPLAPIANAVQLIKMQGGLLDPKLQWGMDVIERQIKQLTHLVDDLLDMARITRGRITLQREPVAVDELIARAAEAIGPLIAARRQTLEAPPPERPIRVQADPFRMAQVLENLLSNAAKYTDEGGRIWITSEREGSEAIIQVRDSGIGMLPDTLHHVFDLFAQADRSLDRTQGGLGIGLTLVRRLMEMHGGTIEAASAGLGRGSEFTIRLPALEEAEAQPAEEPLERLDMTRSGNNEVLGESSHKVLIVDDNADAANSLGELLALWGFRTQVAYEGASAIEAAARDHPDVVLLDIGLPGMDGYEVAQRLRSEFFGQDAPLLVALTGYGQEEDRQKAQAAGFDRYFTKPVNLEDLHALLERIPSARP